MSPTAPVIPEDVDAATGSTLTQLPAFTHATVSHSPDVVGVKRAYFWAARLDHVGMGLLRLGLVIVLLWIGGLKFAPATRQTASFRWLRTVRSEASSTITAHQNIANT